MVYYAVIDTDVLVSALLTKDYNDASVKVLNAVLDKKLIPLFHRDILAEYMDVLCSRRFPFKEETLLAFINIVKQYGIEVFFRRKYETIVPIDNLIFYQVVMKKRDMNAYLITGNPLPYPRENFIVTPDEMLKVIGISDFL